MLTTVCFTNAPKQCIQYNIIFYALLYLNQGKLNGNIKVKTSYPLLLSSKTKKKECYCISVTLTQPPNELN